MKKKIAVFASGWASQILNQFLTGLENSFLGKQIDTYLFLCYPSWATSAAERKGEFNILRLPELSEFDGAIIVSNGLEFNDEIQFLCRKCRDSGKPSVSIGIKADGLYFVGVDNAIGMRQLCTHLVTEHSVRKAVFIAGSKDNADSNLRLEVLKQVFAEKGFSFDDENVFYSNWENAKAISFIKEYCLSGKRLPDAFVCANDGLAMIVCSELENNGYSIPKDVIVTGFDNIADAKVNAPSITSVNQNYELLGKESGKLLTDVFDGKERDKEIIISSYLAVSESCCMSKAEDVNELRRIACRENNTSKGEDTLLDRKLNQIERLILKGNTFREIKCNLIAALGSEYNFEGDSFHIILEPTFEMSIYNANVMLVTDGYSKELLVAFSMENGVVSSAEYFKKNLLIPDHVEDEKEHLYAFLPIHEEEKTYGYFVMCDCLKRINSHFLSKYQQRLNIALGRYRQKLTLDELNKKLTEITRIDTLTHVKNRTAYENRSRELQAEIRMGKNPVFAIAMFDVNNLKKINDIFGHDAGDAYIKNSCALICHTFKHSSVFRIGGDEFLAILMNEDYENADNLVAFAQAEMKRLAEGNNPEVECVSFAIGVSRFNPETDDDVQTVFKRADTLMYKNKEIMKKGDVR